MSRIAPFYTLVIATLALLGACSSTQLLISSTPDGAEVTTFQGEILGKTPLTLKPDQSAKIADNGLLNLKIVAPGYLPRLIFADMAVSRDINVVLPKSDSAGFKAEFSHDFGRDLNKMLRMAFVIQKMLGQKKLTEAEAEVENFKKEFPSLAYGYIMAAHLALMQNKTDDAKVSLQRARVLDPEDPDIVQSLKFISNGVSP